MRPLNDPAGASAPSDRRNQTRRSAMWSGQLETVSGQRVSCVVLDVSAAGAKIQLDHPIAKDDIVQLISGRIGAHWCRVAWLEGGRVGLDFLESHAEAPSSSSQGQDAKFLRGRANVLRRLALTATSLEAAGKLIQSARELEEAATKLEQRQAAPSIRKGG
jgi:PilZ domain